MRHYEAALSIYRAVFGPEHPDVGAVLDNIGGLLSRHGRHDEALARRLEAVEIIRNARGEQHPDLVNPLLNLGYTYFALGRFDTAWGTHREALAIHGATRGTGFHLELVLVLSAIADDLRELGHDEQALHHARRSLQLAETSSLPPPIPVVLAFARAVGANRGDVVWARQLMQEALRRVDANPSLASYDARIRSWLAAHDPPGPDDRTSEHKTQAPRSRSGRGR